MVNIPDSSKRGGVAAYYKTVGPYLPKEISYFTVGSRARTCGLFSNGLRLVRDYIRFFRTLAKECPHLVVLNPSLKSKAVWRDSVFLRLATSRETKVLVFFHGWDQTMYNWFLRGGRHRFFSRSYGNANACVVLAKTYYEQLIGLGYTKSIFCETTAVPDSVFAGCSALNQARTRIGDPFRILFLARIEKNKGIFETLAAFELLSHSYPQAFLTVAGDGSALASARRYAQSRGLANISFRGHLEGAEKEKVLSDSHCYLFPTNYGEGMPTTVLEAMAFGLPIVTRPVGGVIDFFKDKEMGFLSETTQPADLVLKLRILLEQPELARTIGRRNREHASAHFRASSVARRWLTICEQVIGTPLP